MGRGQVVRQRVLVPLLGGSNPSVPDCFWWNKRWNHIVLRTRQKFIKENNDILFFLIKHNKVLSPVKLTLFIFMKKWDLSGTFRNASTINHLVIFFFFLLVFESKKYENSITTKNLQSFHWKSLFSYIVNCFWYGKNILLIEF